MARVGIADMAAGRYTAFDDASSLDGHFDRLAAAAIKDGAAQAS